MTRRGKVLVLDDDVLTGKTIQKIAEFNNYDAKLATEPEIFFSLYSEWKPDYIAIFDRVLHLVGQRLTNWLSIRPGTAELHGIPLLQALEFAPGFLAEGDDLGHSRAVFALERVNEVEALFKLLQTRGVKVGLVGVMGEFRL